MAPKRSTLRNLVLLRSEEHTSELQSQSNLVCRLLLEKKKKKADRRGSRFVGKRRERTIETLAAAFILYRAELRPYPLDRTALVDQRRTLLNMAVRSRT